MMKLYEPSAPVRALMLSDEIVTEAPWTGAPVLAVTRPETVICAPAIAGRSSNASDARKLFGSLSV